MSGDLISRKETIESVKRIIRAGLPEDAIYAEIENIPSAYYVDNVLDKIKKMMYEESSCEGAIWIRKCIDIVRNGGNI